MSILTVILVASWFVGTAYMVQRHDMPLIGMVLGPVFVWAWPVILRWWLTHTPPASDLEGSEERDRLRESDHVYANPTSLIRSLVVHGDRPVGFVHPRPFEAFRKSAPSRAAGTRESDERGNLTDAGRVLPS